MTIETTRRIEAWARNPAVWFAAMAAVQSLIMGLEDVTEGRQIGWLAILASTLGLTAGILLLPGRVRTGKTLAIVAIILMSVHLYLWLAGTGR